MTVVIVLGVTENHTDLSPLESCTVPFLCKVNAQLVLFLDEPERCFPAPFAVLIILSAVFIPKTKNTLELCVFRIVSSVAVELVYEEIFVLALGDVEQNTECIVAVLCSFDSHLVCSCRKLHAFSVFGY